MRETVVIPLPLGTHTEHGGHWRKSAKLGPSGSERDHVAWFFNFGTPSISREWLKVETSNLAYIYTTRGAEEKWKIRWNEVGMGHLNYFFEFWDPTISPERVKPETSSLAWIWNTRSTEDKCKISSQEVRNGSRELLLKLWDPIHITEMVEARNFKFGTQGSNTTRFEQ